MRGARAKSMFWIIVGTVGVLSAGLLLIHLSNKDRPPAPHRGQPAEDAAIPTKVHHVHALAGAAFVGDAEAVRRLLHEGVAVDAQEPDGGTALLLACQAGKTEAAKLLLEAGANVNCADHAGNTPLLYAAGLHRKDLVVLLISYGAEVNARDRRGNTPLTLSLSAGGS